MQEKVWSRSWVPLWFFRCWGGLWIVAAIITIGSWDLAASQRALLDDHIVVPAIVQDKRVQVAIRGGDQACMDVMALLPNPRGFTFRHCVPALDVEEVHPGDIIEFLVSPDGKEVAHGPIADLEARVRSNTFFQPIVRILFVALSAFMLWRFVPALTARAGDVVWVKVRSAEYVGGGVMGGGMHLRVCWEDPVTGSKGRARDLRLKSHMPSDVQLRKRKGLRMLKATTGRLWWEAELPGFKGDLTRFPGEMAAGWANDEAAHARLAG